MGRTFEVQPSARRLMGSLRDIGYDFNTAIADLVDNCVEARAHQVDIWIRYDGPRSYVRILDDGTGMTGAGITEALRFGSDREYSGTDLGRYGLGLKTASLSQCRRLTVVSRRSSEQNRIHMRQLDLQQIERTDRWEIVSPDSDGNVDRAAHQLRDRPGTVVLWEDLDRVFGATEPTSGWAKRRLVRLEENLGPYLGMVFHRFLEGAVAGREQIHITVNGEKVRPWNPFAPNERTAELPLRQWELTTSVGTLPVELRRYVLPPREAFSTHEEFERLGGPQKWNRQQGLYIYRSDRLIQSGGWCGLRTLDEHLKLARASLDFPSALDQSFRVNVAKMRVAVPPDVRDMLTDPVSELCREADAVYRAHAKERSSDPGVDGGGALTGKSVAGAGLAVRAAAMAAGIHGAQLTEFGQQLRRTSPDVADLLGF